MGKKREGLGNRSKKLTGEGEQTLVGFTNETKWQQTNREHRYKYTGDNGEDGQPGGGGDKHKER
jgi:hypothetical protein